MAVSYVPEGCRTVTPHLICLGASKAIDFYKKAFGAVELARMAGPDGNSIMHAEIKIGDSMVFVVDQFPSPHLASPEKLGATTVGMHLYVKDCDSMFNQAVAAGARISMPLMNMFWGDRFGKVIDPFGHEWSIATHIEDVPPADMKKRMEEAMKQMGKPQG